MTDETIYEGTNFIEEAANLIARNLNRSGRWEKDGVAEPTAFEDLNKSKKHVDHYFHIIYDQKKHN